MIVKTDSIIYCCKLHFAINECGLVNNNNNNNFAKRDYSLMMNDFSL